MNLDKVLIIRFSSIGDIILTSPVIRCLKKQFGSEIHILTKESNVGLFQNNSYVDQIHAYHSDKGSLNTKLKQENFDYIIDLHKNIRSKKVIAQLSKPNIAFDKINIQKWLKVNFKIDRLPEKHLVDRYFESLQKIGLKNDQLGLDYFLNEESIAKTYPYTIALGAAHYTKRIPTESIISIIEKVNHPVALLGGPNEQEIGEDICQKTKMAINYAGKTSIDESASLIAKSKILVSPDTGMMHMAAALKKPVLAIWGNTIPKFGMSPYYGKHDIPHLSFEVKNLNCRPCSKIGKKTCPKGHFKCMKNHDIDDIVEKILGFIE